MNQVAFQRTLARVLALGASGVTIFLVTGNVTDPVNAPKLFLLGGLAGAALLLLAYLVIHKLYRFTGLEPIILAFNVWSLVALFASDSPISQGIYGVYGRNTGYLAYTFLSVVAIAATQLASRSQFKLILEGFLFALLINLSYGLWVLLFGDFLGWQNNYGALLGTFGNPNFISSFLGLGFALVFALAIRSARRERIALLLSLPLVAWQLREANSLQGIVVAVLGVGVVGYFWLRQKSQSKTWSVAYLIFGAISSVVAVAGALGSGPLKHVLAQPTVALREQYWSAAITLAKSHPVLGVGMDAYGDWYRRARGPQALITPGPDTVTNVAHNVFLDILSYGGYPLFILYMLITALSAFSIIRAVKRSKDYDPILAGITVLWVGYQAQSIISINQIGLAVWGWLINGLAISYQIVTRENSSEKSGNGPAPKKNTQKRQETFSPQLIAGIGVVAGLLIAVPPLSADTKWREVLLSRQIEKVEPALRGSYMTPINSFRLVEAVQLLENNKLPDYAIIYARRGVKYNHNYFEAWRMLYYATNSTPEEKATAKLNMIRLDPLNPEWKSLA